MTALPAVERAWEKNMYHAEYAENTEENIITLRDLCELVRMEGDYYFNFSNQGPAFNQ